MIRNLSAHSAVRTLSSATTMHTLFGATALAALLTAPAAAQTVFELDEIIFSATAAPIELERIGTSASVVTAEELQATGEVRVIDFLARLPGVDVRSRGPIGTQSSISIRGVGQSYVRVIVDSIDVTDVAGPQVAYDFGALTTMDVERIEVLRGGQSALYGSEAIGGVINITTRRPEEGTVAQFVTLEAGSYNTFSGSYGVAADHGALDFALTLSRTQTDGFSAADEDDGNGEADGYEANRLSFWFGYDLDGGARIGLNGFYEESVGDYDEGFPLADGTPDDVTENTSFGLRAFAEFQTGDIDNTVALTYYELERDFDSPSSFGAFNSFFLGERVGFSYLGAASVTPTLDVRFGLDATRETFRSANNFGSMNSGENDVVGVFTEFHGARPQSLTSWQPCASTTTQNLGTSRLAVSPRPGVRLRIGFSVRPLPKASAPRRYLSYTALKATPPSSQRKACLSISARNAVLAQMPSSGRRISTTRRKT